MATRARDVAVEDAARSKALVGAHERTIEELRREVRSHATRSEELSPELVEGELGRERKQSEELVNKQSEELAELRAKVRDAEEQTRKATDALVKTEAWARAAEKALAAEKASSPKAKGATATSASAKAAVEGSVVAGSNPVSAAVSPLRPLDANAGDGGGSRDEKRLEKRLERRREEPPSTAPSSSVENLPELLSSHAPSPARPARVAAAETPREETERPSRRRLESTGVSSTVSADRRRLADVAAELRELRPALDSLQKALGSIDMKPHLDALRLGRRAPRPCEALAAILALSVTDPRLFDGFPALTLSDVADALLAGDAFGSTVSSTVSTVSNPDPSPTPGHAVHERWMAVRGHLNHHAVTVGDGAHGELATRTRVEPLDVRTAASCDDDFGAGQPCREDLAFAVSQLKALVEGGLGEAEAAASGCVVCELLHAWSVAAVRTRQLIGQRSDAEERLRSD